MRTFIYIAVAVFIASAVSGCKKKFTNQVPIEQYHIDGSTDYRFIFKGAVEDERKKDIRFKPNEFKD